MVILLRLIHIFAGISWAGGAFLATGFIEPTVRALGPEGGKFMQRMSGPGKFALYMTWGSILTALSGILLYWEHSNGFDTNWIRSSSGLALTIGGSAGIIATVYGGAVTGPTTTKMAEVGKKIQAAGGPPSPELMAEMTALSAKLTQSGRISSLLLIIAVVGMALS